MKPVSVRQNVVWYVLSLVLAKGATVLLLPVYTRVLAPAELGTAMVVLAVGAMANLVVAPGIETVYVRCAYLWTESDAARRRGLSTVILLHLAMAGAGLAALLGTAPFISAWWLKGIPLWPFYYAMVGILLCSTLEAPLRSSWRAEHRADKIVLVEFISALISTATIVTALLVLKWGAISLLLGDLAAGAILSPLYARHIVRTLRAGWGTWDRRVFKTVAPVVLVGIPMSLSGYVLSGLDRVALHRWSGPSAVGLYAAGYQVGVAVMALALLLNREWQPLILQLTEPRERRSVMLQELWTRSVTLFLVLGSAVSLFSAEIVRVYLGPQYRASAPLVPPIVLMCMLRIPRYFFVYAGLSLGRTRDLTVDSLLSAAVFAVATVGLIPQWGPAGAAWACVVAYAVSDLFLFTRPWNVFGLDRYLVTWVIASGAITALAIAYAGSALTQFTGAVVIGTGCFMAARYWRLLGTIDVARVQRA